MKISELSSDRRPTVYLDMDGVICDLFNHVAVIHDVDHYDKMSDEEWDRFLQTSDAYHLFRDLPGFPSNTELLDIISKYADKYRILSSPLRFDKEGSIRGKREWLENHVDVLPEKMIFDHDKWKYAVQSDGTPNILIDDWKVNTKAWEQAGGIAIKFQADEDSLDKVEQALQKIFKR